MGVVKNGVKFVASASAIGFLSWTWAELTVKSLLDMPRDIYDFVYVSEKGYEPVQTIYESEDTSSRRRVTPSVMLKGVRYKLSTKYRNPNQKIFPIKHFVSFLYTTVMSDNKLVKTVMDAATLTGLAAGIGWIAKKSVQ